MADLSPAAQAIVDAWDAKLNPDPDGLTYMTHDPEREALAAALRAAVDQASKSIQPHPAYSEAQLWAFFCGAGRMADQFRALAAELEGAR